MKKKIAVYTVLTNGYDTLRPIRPERGFDYFVFTDDKDFMVAGWQPILIEKGDVYKQREIKLLPHKHLPNHNVTIYVDANMQLRLSVQQILRAFKGGVMLSKHLKRNCVYEEAKECIAQNKAPKEKIEKQVKRYRKMGFPERFGMWSTGFIVRENSERVNAFCEVWNKELQSQTHRDQLSIGYAIKEIGIKPQQISYQQMRRFVRINKHKHKVSKEIKVFYSSPFRSDKNIGKANNDFIKLLPDDAWVCITDGDAMFLNPDYGKRVEDIIMNHGDKWDLIGCLTNRIGSNHQCYNSQFSNEMDMREHWKIAHSSLEDKVIEGGVAGFFMLFSKRTWQKAGGFKTKSISCDTQFNKDVRKTGGKVGVYQGLYMFHAYRINENDQRKAQQSISHLR